MHIRWARSTAPWIQSTFDDKTIKLTDITSIRNTLAELEAAKDVDLQIERADTAWTENLRQRYPRAANYLPSSYMSRFKFYREKCMEPFVQLTTRAINRNISVGVELQRGVPVGSASLSKTFLPNHQYHKKILNNPLKVAATCQVKWASWRLPKLELTATQPVMEDRRIVGLRSMSLATCVENSYWWTDRKFKSDWIVRASGHYGSVYLNDWSRLHVKPQKLEWNTSLGKFSLKPSFGLSLRRDLPNPALGLTFDYGALTTIRDIYFLEKRFACGALASAHPIPPDEYLALGRTSYNSPTRGKPFSSDCPRVSSAEGLRDGLFASISFGRRGVLHQSLGLFTYLDGLISYRNSAMNSCSAGVGLGLQVTPDLTLEASLGASPITKQALWDVRVNGNF